jgi:hypothetical protein
MTDEPIDRPVPAPTDAEAEAAVLQQMTEQVKSGANWFYWIAGLSAVNTALDLFGANIRFILGLGITQVVDAIARESGNPGGVVPLVANAIAIGVFVLFGIKANQKLTWAFVVGMLLYALDGALLFLFEDWKGIAFHALALFFLFKGFSALRELKKVEAQRYAIPGVSQVKTD